MCSGSGPEAELGKHNSLAVVPCRLARIRDHEVTTASARDERVSWTPRDRVYEVVSRARDNSISAVSAFESVAPTAPDQPINAKRFAVKLKIVGASAAHETIAAPASIQRVGFSATPDDIVTRIACEAVVPGSAPRAIGRALCQVTVS